MRERKPVPFLPALTACTVINRVCVKVITGIPTQARTRYLYALLQDMVSGLHLLPSLRLREHFHFHSTDKPAVRTLPGAQ